MEHRAELVEIIRRVRNRWRVRLALRGAVIVLAGIVLTLFLSASSLEQLRFTPASIIAFRIVAIAVFAALVVVALLKPLMRQVSDAQVALYLEECDPTLETALLSAIEAATSTSVAHSPHLVERLVQEAVEKCRAADHARVDRTSDRSAPCGDVRDDCRRCVRRRPRRTGVSATRPVGAPHHLAQRGSGEPVQDRCPPGQRESAPRLGSDRTREAARLLLEGRDADGADRAGRRVRSRASGADVRPGGFRGSPLSSRQGLKIFRRGERRPLRRFTMTVLDLPTVRARARVPLSAVHRFAAAQSRTRRRRRGAARHRRDGCASFRR